VFEYCAGNVTKDFLRELEKNRSEVVSKK
jgi:hypothetical protein